MYKGKLPKTSLFVSGYLISVNLIYHLGQICHKNKPPDVWIAVFPFAIMDVLWVI